MRAVWPLGSARLLGFATLLGCSLLPSYASAAEAQASAAEAQASAAEEPPVRGPRAIELEGSVATTFTLGQPAYPDQQLSFNSVGLSGRLAVSYRTNYPVLPYFGIEHARLASGATAAADGTVYGQRLAATVFLPGVFFELEPVRLRLGLGFANSLLELSHDGEVHGSSQLAFAAEVGVSVTVVRTRFFTTNLEGRYLDAGGADLRYFSFGLSLRGDLWSNGL